MKIEKIKNIEIGEIEISSQKGFPILHKKNVSLETIYW
jgi:hypothetical protein